MAGIYIHIPFCKQACHYCNFHFSTSLQYKNEFIAALLKEIALPKKELSCPAGGFENEKIETIYFGGGTPGILSVEEIETILNAVKENYNCDQIRELTSEMNPDDVSEEKIAGFKQLGIDRISLGVQSFFEEDLLYMNRSHSAHKAVESIEIIAASFQNFTVDLIYGYPLLTDDKLAKNVSTLIEKGAPHISIYGMTVEPKTALDSFIKKGKEKPIDADKGAHQFEYLMNRLAQDGFEHYEISSYAKEGFRAIHNSNYWAGKKYIGFGPGAHSYDGQKRSWNIANNARYIKSLDKNELNQEYEILSQTDMLNELVLLGLRVTEGLALLNYKSKSTANEFNSLLQKAEAHIQNNLLEKTPTHIRLTPKGKLFCDAVSADLFV